MLPSEETGMRFFRGSRPEEATYTIEQLLALRLARGAVAEDAALFGGRAPLVLQAVPAEEAAASNAARDRQARREATKARPKVIGPITECVPVDAEVLQARRGELRRIEQMTGVQIREKAGLRNFTIMITGTTSIVEAALLMVEEAISEKYPNLQQPERPPPPPVLEPPMEPPPPRPIGHGTSFDDADMVVLTPMDDTQSSAHAVEAQLPDHTRPPQQAADSPPADEEWEIPAHWQRPAARSDPAPKKVGRKGGDQNWSESNGGWTDNGWNEWQEGSKKWDEKDWWKDGGWSADAAGGASSATWLDGTADKDALHTTSGVAAETSHVQEEASCEGEDSLAVEDPFAEDPLAPIPGRWRQNRFGVSEPPKPAEPTDPLENHLLAAGSQSSDENDEDYIKLRQEVCKSPPAPPPQKDQVAKSPPTDMTIPPTKPPPPELCKPPSPVSAWDICGPPGETRDDNIDAGKTVSKPAQAASAVKEKDQVTKPTPPVVAKPAPPDIARETTGPPGDVDEPTPKKGKAGAHKANKKNNAVVAKPPPAAVVKPVPPVAAKPPPVAVAKPAPPVIPSPSAWETMAPPFARPPPPPSPLDAPGEPGKPSVASPKVKASPPAPQLAPVRDEVEVALPMKQKALEAKQKAAAKPKLGVKAKSAPKGANPLPQRSAAAAQVPKPAVAVSGDSRSAAASTAWLDRPVERLSETNAYYEEEDDPDLASYLWKGQSPKSDQTRVAPKLAAAPPSVLPKPAPVPDEVMSIKAAPTATPARPKLGVKAKQSQAKGANPLPQRTTTASQAAKPAPIMVSGGLAAVSGDSRNAASSQKWLERPVEKLSSANAYYEEEDDPDLAAYLWDRKAQRPKNDQMRVVPKRAAAAASQRIPAPSQQRQRALLTQVMEMGFDENSAKRALTETGWNTVEEALAALCGS